MRLSLRGFTTTSLLTLVQQKTLPGYSKAYGLAAPFATKPKKCERTSIRYSTKRDDDDGIREINTMSNSEKDGIVVDEVAAAKEAAVAYRLSSEDEAGPATVFDKILSKEWSSTKVYEDDVAYAFRDINPKAPTHILVIPKVRDGLVQLSKAREDQKELLGHLMYVAQEVGKKECPKGFRVVVNDGEDGAQSVYHLHLHVMGGREMGWPPG